MEYSKALTLAGLNHEVRKDAVREGDGPAMVDHWSFDIIHFGNRNHPKYMALAHHFLAGTDPSLLLLFVLLVIRN